MTSLKFSEFQSQHRRLAVLRGLQQAVAGYRASALLLRSYCEAVGHTALTGDLEADLAWLSLAGLVDLHTDQGVTSATLTAKGLDVATGHAIVEGVQRPGPAG
jgi:hypothetical protein